LLQKSRRDAEAENRRIANELVNELLEHRRVLQAEHDEVSALTRHAENEAQRMASSDYQTRSAIEALGSKLAALTEVVLQLGAAKEAEKAFSFTEATKEQPRPGEKSREKLFPSQEPTAAPSIALPATPSAPVALMKTLRRLIPEYSGEDRSPIVLENFLARLTDYLNVDTRTAEFAVSFGWAYLRKDAEVWYRENQRTIGESWRLFIDGLRETFKSSNYETVARQKIDTLTQGTKSFEEYLAEFRTLASQINMTDQERAHRFVTGLNSRIRLQVMLDRADTNFKAAIEAGAVAANVFAAQRRPYYGVYSKKRRT